MEIVLDCGKYPATSDCKTSNGFAIIDCDDVGKTYLFDWQEKNNQIKTTKKLNLVCFIGEVEYLMTGTDPSFKDGKFYIYYEYLFRPVKKRKKIYPNAD